MGTILHTWKQELVDRPFALAVIACIAVVTGCRTPSDPMSVRTKERLKISADKSFYVARGKWDAPFISSLAHPNVPATLPGLVEDRLRSEGLVVAKSFDTSDYAIVFSVVAESGSSILRTQQSIESMEMVVIERSSNTVVIGGSKNCCISINDVAAQAAGFIRSIVKERGVFLPRLAESPVTDDPCKDAENQFELDLDQKSWGAIYPEQMFAPQNEDPSATVLVGKDLNYLTSYLACYHSEVKGMKFRRAVYGCAAGCAVSALALAWIFMPR